jgi:Fe2+ or Zn2+ uptake regulation protein
MNRRQTLQKKTILTILRKTDTHPTADWIYDEVRKVLPHISKGTVYRNLKILGEDGEVSELHLNGDASRYDGNMSPHYHFRCEGCGKLYDIDEPFNAEIDERVMKKTGFMILYHHLEFRGFCHTCQNNKEREKEGYINE